MTMFFRLRRKIDYHLSSISWINQLKWNSYRANNTEIKIIIGASSTKFKGWFPTEKSFLNISNPLHFKRLFHKLPIDAILAEHVLEHLTNKDLELMVKNFYNYSSARVTIRVAVPDGYHTNPAYIGEVKPGGTGEGAFDHKNLFTYKSLSALFEKGGFKAHPVEYWDENGTFHRGYVNDDKGYVLRSFINDPRNRKGKPNYTSLIVDFRK